MLKHLRTVGLMGVLCVASSGCSLWHKPAAAKPQHAPLGQYAQIALPSRNVQASVAFYENFGFVVVEQDEMPEARALMSDGRSFIQLLSGGFAAPRLEYFSDVAGQRGDALRKVGVHVDFEEGHGPRPGREVMASPEATVVNIVHRSAPVHDVSSLGPIHFQSSGTAPLSDGPIVRVPSEDVPSSTWFYQVSGMRLVDGSHLLSDGKLTVLLAPGTSRTALLFRTSDLAGMVAKLRGAGVVVADVSATQAQVRSPDGMQIVIEAKE